uniref:hypothetical protein n=1 Tax=Leucobacter soli TaxID=2812850 RepID=UPI001C407323
MQDRTDLRDRTSEVGLAGAILQIGAILQAERRRRRESGKFEGRERGSSKGGGAERRGEDEAKEATKEG